MDCLITRSEQMNKRTASFALKEKTRRMKPVSAGKFHKVNFRLFFHLWRVPVHHSWAASMCFSTFVCFCASVWEEQNDIISCWDLATSCFALSWLHYRSPAHRWLMHTTNNDTIHRALPGSLHSSTWQCRDRGWWKPQKRNVLSENPHASSVTRTSFPSSWVS